VNDTNLEKPDKAEEIVSQLKSKKQVIFYGPPGTGKTYVAQSFANWWINKDTSEVPVHERFQTVTFHPSFTYEDFVEGLSAQSDERGAMKYRMEEGILKRMAETAREELEATDNGEEPPRFVLVIDEINRGNVAQIFGETITLLEADKRGTVTTQLAHSDTSFSIPPNLYIIGTMNTADRSISLVDAALRRRFRFLPFAPDFNTLCEYHDIEGIETAAEQVKTGSDDFDVLLGLSILAVKQINEKILDSPDLGKGKQIGHSYLMQLDDIEDIVNTWKYDILPLLEEYYFSQFGRIRQDIFAGNGRLLVDWDREQIKEFSPTDLLQTLEDLVEIDAALSGIDTTTSAASSTENRSSTTITTKAEMLDDVEAKHRSGEISNEIHDTFLDLFEFAQDIGDDVEINRAKNASFGLQVDAHQGEYDGSPNVFTANINDEIKIWPAKFPITGSDDDEDPVAWNIDAYERFRDQFQSLDRVQSDENSANFEVVAHNDNLEQIKEIVTEFVTHCREAAENAEV